jgi:hypothetical protein
MSDITPVTATDVANRLRNLRELVETRADSHWGREEIDAVLDQDPAGADAKCPRYAGVLEESRDECVILADTPEELAADMQTRADNDIPIVPVELVDLDTGATRLADRETTVRFIDADERCGGAAAAQEPSGCLVLLVVTHRNGTNHSLARDEQHAYQLLYEWVTEWWPYEQSRGSKLGGLPDDRGRAIDEYFAAVETERAETIPLQLPDGFALMKVSR